MNPNDPFQQGPTVQPQQPQTPQQPNSARQFDTTPTPLPGAGGGVNGGHNPYEFIMTSNQQPKKKFGFGGGQNSPIKLLIIVGGIAAVLFIAGLIVTALLPKGASAVEMQSIVQRQAEMSRVAKLAERNADSETTKSAAYNIDFSMNSSQQATLAVMESKGLKMDEKEIALKQDSTTDTTLDAAKATGSYDSTFEQLMSDQLTAYLGEVKATYANTTSTEVKATLQELYDDGSALLKQVEN